MPYEIDLGKPPAGYSLTTARENEEMVVQYMEFTSTEDGQHFIKRLEGFPNSILQKLPTPILPSQIHNMLAIIRPDGKATVYVNEPIQRALARASRPIKAGSSVTKDDLVEIDRLELDVEIPNSAGVLFLFSVGWRKGLYYDFGPISGPDLQLREYDLFAILGQAYCYVLYQERFTISETEWQSLFLSKWFPFAALRNDIIDKMISYVRADINPDDLTDVIVSHIKSILPQMLASWRNHTSFSPHIEILERAAERFQNDDFVSCTALLFPRIEGLLRSLQIAIGSPCKTSPVHLADAAVVSRSDNPYCLLLPHKFTEYLREVYFANFNPVAQEIDVSRHSVAHGVASATNFNCKSAVIGILSSSNFGKLL